MVKPGDVLGLTKPTPNFLCPLTANTYGIDFISFKIRDYDGGKTIFEVNKEVDPNNPTPLPVDIDDSVRCIHYTFPLQFLELKTIGTTLVFSVGPKPVPNFRMIERHYFRDRLIKSYDFNFGFCIPNSTNSWEAIYQMPKLSAAERRDILEHPFETKSDSFYFVNDELIMHNKAEYQYK
mmetsp:Transcript_45910/g.74907  ORF Transcript_45910/g.74907 Transcript_45910/m.74907 type:complete len:179 (-) Transcript_45910:861-1397(-)|eukprot:CAMPEP_0184656038 /NCGR_PEP_ID=MMETSP0308-20130426/15404_1 /TAXON_ID=38269 /ORGANISM="Gloeochaete witrockiana, Strain SAG 46.84" /LENGTH=178 /DNA_ID=CAMNT_0027092939 /DNA_START=121 /DNA_END=657 /DNA_ORIENTATION=+